MRSALALLAMGIGYVSISSNFAEIIVLRSPATAHDMAPFNGRVSALAASKHFADQPDPGKQDATRQLALRALRQDATAIPAVVTLGLQAQLRGDLVAARKLFAYSQHLSRRDLQTQMWAIEDSVSRGDIPAVLRHYDIALRTSKTAPDLLFPVMAQALVEPDIRRGLIKVLATQPIWGPAFLTYVSNNRDNPQSLAAFLLGLSRAGVALPSSTVAGALDGLVTSGAFDTAWRFYASIKKGVDPSQSRDPLFKTNLQAPSVFDWMPVNDAGISSSIQRDGDKGVFEFAASPSVGGILLKQMQMLRPGTYRIEGHSTGIDQPPQSAPYWALLCQDGRELGRVEMPKSTEMSGAFSGQFGVPAGCPVQTLVLAARPSDAIAGSTGQIDHVRLFPAK